MEWKEEGKLVMVSGEYQISKPLGKAGVYWVHQFDCLSKTRCRYRGQFKSFDEAKLYCLKDVNKSREN